MPTRPLRDLEEGFSIPQDEGKNPTKKGQVKKNHNLHTHHGEKKLPVLYNLPQLAFKTIDALCPHGSLPEEHKIRHSSYSWDNQDSLHSEK